MLRRVHGGAVPAGALTLVEPGLGERHGTRTEAKRKIAAAALDLLPGADGSVAPRRRHHHGRPRRAPARRPRAATSPPTRCRSPPGCPAPRRHAARAGRPGPRDHPDRRRRGDRPGAARPARRRRLPRHQRHQPGARLQHARRGRGRHQAGHGARRRSGSSCWPTAASSAASTWCASPPSRTSTSWSPTARPTPASSPSWRRWGSRCWSHDVHRDGHVVTLTANPSLDRTLELPGPLVARRRHPARRRRHRARRQGRQRGPGGRRGRRRRRLGPARPPTHDPIVTALHALGLRARHRAGRARRSAPTTRSPTPTARRPSSTSPAPPSTDATRAALTGVLHGHAAGARWVVLSGSLPPGTPVDWYADLVRALRDTGARVAVDTSEAPLLALLAAGPDAAPRPAQAQRRGAGPAGRRRRGRRPRATPRPPWPPSAPCTTAAWPRCCSPSAPTARCCRTPTATLWSARPPADRRPQHRRRRRLQPRRLPARRPGRRAAGRAAAHRRRLRRGQRRRSPDPPSPPRPRSTSPASGSPPARPAIAPLRRRAAAPSTVPAAGRDAR